MIFDAKDARAIAKKLDATIEPGRKHDNVVVKYQGKEVASFGIRRGSGEIPHNYIPKQLFISPHNCREFCACTLSLEWYFEQLKIKGKLPAE